MGLSPLKRLAPVIDVDELPNEPAADEKKAADWDDDDKWHASGWGWCSWSSSSAERSWGTVHDEGYSWDQATSADMYVQKRVYVDGMYINEPPPPEKRQKSDA